MIYFPVKSFPNSANPSGISRYKIRKNNPLHFQHLRHPLVSAHSKGNSTPLDSAVTRLARIVVVNIPHHVTQRGNARQFILASDDERTVYLDLLRKYVLLHDLSLLGYCLMSNHVHLVVVPRKPDALALALKQTHERYA